jgi:type II secretion system protein N
VQLPHINLGPRARKILRYAGIAVLGLIVFVFALQMTLPFERAKDKLIEAASPSYDITIAGIERGWIPGRVYLTGVSIRTRPTKPDETVTVFYIEKLRGDLGLLALIGGNLSLDLDAKIGNGHINGNVTLPGFGRKGLEVHVDGKDLPASNLPMRGLIGLPMSGKIEFEIALDLPNETAKNGHTGASWQKAEGEIEIGCPSGCTFGDGKTKLKPLLKNRSQQVMVQDGIDFGKLDIDTLSAKVEIKGGNLDVTKFDIKSGDGELHVDYHMKLEPELGESIVTGCLRFKGTDALLKKEPKTYGAIQTTGAELRADGLFHIKLADRFKDMKRLNAECGPNAKGEGPSDTGVAGGVRPPARPTITVVPDDAGRPGPMPMTPATGMTAPIVEAAGRNGSAVPSAPGQPGGGGGRVEREREGAEGQQAGSAGSGEVAPGSGTAGAAGAGQVLQKH